MKKWMILATILAVLSLGSGLAIAAPPVKAPDFPVTMTVILAGDCDRGEESIDIQRGQYFKVNLYAAGGTGYTWTLADHEFSLLELAGDSVEPVEPDSMRAGGRVKWSYYLKVKDEAAGQEVIKFVLKRGWEKTASPARSFDLTVVAR